MTTARLGLIALLLVGLAPALASCATDCSGTVQHQVVEGDQVKLRVHSNTATGADATFCDVTGSRAELYLCDAGAAYPRCKVQR